MLLDKCEGECFSKNMTQVRGKQHFPETIPQWKGYPWHVHMHVFDCNLPDTARPNMMNACMSKGWRCIRMGDEERAKAHISVLNLI